MKIYLISVEEGGVAYIDENFVFSSEEEASVFRDTCFRGDVNPKIIVVDDSYVLLKSVLRAVMRD